MLIETVSEITLSVDIGPGETVRQIFPLQVRVRQSALDGVVHSIVSDLRSYNSTDGWLAAGIRLKMTKGGIGTCQPPTRAMQTNLDFIEALPCNRGNKRSQESKRLDLHGGLIFMKYL